MTGNDWLTYQLFHRRYGLTRMGTVQCISLHVHSVQYTQNTDHISAMLLWLPRPVSSIHFFLPSPPICSIRDHLVRNKSRPFLLTVCNMSTHGEGGQLKWKTDINGTLWVYFLGSSINVYLGRVYENSLHGRPPDEVVRKHVSLRLSVYFSTDWGQ